MRTTADLMPRVSSERIKLFLKLFIKTCGGCALLLLRHCTCDEEAARFIRLSLVGKQRSFALADKISRSDSIRFLLFLSYMSKLLEWVKISHIGFSTYMGEFGY